MPEASALRGQATALTSNTSGVNYKGGMMAKSEKPQSNVFEGADKELKTVARAGPAGVLLVAVIILALLAIVVFGTMLLFRR